jgi:hypothetical protein
MSQPPIEPLVRADLALALRRLELLLLPQAGFSRGHRIYLPEAGDRHRGLKQNLIQRALDLFYLGNAVASGSAPPAFVEVTAADFDRIEHEFAGDMELDIYVELLMAMQDVQAAVANLAQATGASEIDDGSLGAIDDCVGRIADVLRGPGPISERERQASALVRSACGGFQGDGTAIFRKHTSQDGCLSWRNEESSAFNGLHALGRLIPAN